jgi:hypothetical protein
LGYQFSPRLVDIGEARYWRIDANADLIIGYSMILIETKSCLLQTTWRASQKISRRARRPVEGTRFSGEIVIWNTCYMNAAISKLQAKGTKIKPEDLARLSPLGYQHINMLGRYSFALPESVQKGELRSFHKPFAEVVFEDYF